MALLWKWHALFDILQIISNHVDGTLSFVGGQIDMHPKELQSYPVLVWWQCSSKLSDQTPTKVQQNQIKSYAWMVWCYALQWEMLALSRQPMQTCWTSEAILVIMWLKWSIFHCQITVCLQPEKFTLFKVSSCNNHYQLQTCHALEKSILVRTCKPKHQTVSLGAQFCAVVWWPKKAKLTGVQLQSCKKFLCSSPCSTHTNSKLLSLKVIIHVYQLADTVDIDHKKVLPHNACCWSVICQRMHVVFHSIAICNWIEILGLCVTTTGTLVVHETCYV